MSTTPKTSTIFRFVAQVILVCGIYMGSSITSYSNDSSYTYNDPDSSWQINPIAIHGDATFGFSLPILLRDIGKGNDLKNHPLMTVGGKIDVGLLYVRRWILRHFDCYPQLGLLIKYNHLLCNIQETPYITGGVIYIEPNHDYTTRFEMLPRVGVGMAYLNIPGGFSSVTPYILEPDGSKKSAPHSSNHLEPFRNGADLNVILAMMLKFRLTPHWHMALTLGLDYFPALFTSKDDVLTRAQKAIEIYTVSLSGGYTFYPSDYLPPKRFAPYDDSKMLIDIAFLNSFRKACHEIKTVSKQPKNPQDPQKVFELSDETYYIGGLHIQWSYRVTGSHAFVLGTEWTKDWALEEELKKTVQASSIQVSTMLGHEFTWGKLNFGQYAGVYILSNPPVVPEKMYQDRFYLRLGVNYRITNYLYVGTSLKLDVLPSPRPIYGKQHHVPTEYTRIRYLDFRIGYTF